MPQWIDITWTPYYGRSFWLTLHPHQDNAKEDQVEHGDRLHRDDGRRSEQTVVRCRWEGGSLCIKLGLYTFIKKFLPKREVSFIHRAPMRGLSLVRRLVNV